MGYEPPSCCGRKMVLFTDIYVAVRVKKDGKPSLHSPQMFDYEPNKLLCHTCKCKNYALKDDEGRVIKGEVIR